MPGPHRLERELIVPRPIEEVFDFFSRAENLERLTPDELCFRIHTPLPVIMGEGTLIDYTIRLFGVPLTWRTLIEVWEPGRRFVDLQLKGPYKLWRHEHTFTSVSGGTEVRDVVTYELPFGPVGRAVRGLWVARQLEHIFDYRSLVISQLFGASSAAA